MSNIAYAYTYTYIPYAYTPYAFTYIPYAYTYAYTYTPITSPECFHFMSQFRMHSPNIK